MIFQKLSEQLKSFEPDFANDAEYHEFKTKMDQMRQGKQKHKNKQKYMKNWNEKRKNM